MEAVTHQRECDRCTREGYLLEGIALTSISLDGSILFLNNLDISSFTHESLSTHSITHGFPIMILMHLLIEYLLFPTGLLELFLVFGCGPLHLLSSVKKFCEDS
ncbi:hypothetical protein STEG23_009461 [Scotinomys teguina]